MKALHAAALAAFLVAPAAANAKGYEIKLDGLCDLVGLNVESPYVSGISLTGCNIGNFVGAVAKLKGAQTQSIVASVNYKHQKQGAYLLRIDYPIVTGGAWELFYTKDGYSESLVANGTYSNWHDHGGK